VSGSDCASGSLFFGSTCVIDIGPISLFRNSAGSLQGNFQMCRPLPLPGSQRVSVSVSGLHIACRATCGGLSNSVPRLTAFRDANSERLNITYL
jgi:hypothetical protein